MSSVVLRCSLGRSLRKRLHESQTNVRVEQAEDGREVRVCKGDTKLVEVAQAPDYEQSKICYMFIRDG